MDKPVTLWCMPCDLGLFGTVQHIVVGVLQYCMICARLVPCVLIDDKAARIMTCLSFLQCSAAEGNNCLRQVVTGDDIWICHSLLPVSDELWSGYTPAHPGRRNLK
jgi:hypothetical protein